MRALYSPPEPFSGALVLKPLVEEMSLLFSMGAKAPLLCVIMERYIGECYVFGIMNGEFLERCEQQNGEPGCPEEQEFALR